MASLTLTIMAAGEGKRMKSPIPKVLHLFYEKPFLIRILLECYKLSPNKIIIITGKYDELIKDTIRNYFLSNNMCGFDKIIFVKQSEPLGTGNAIYSTLPFYESNENVLILNGDMPLISYNVLNYFIKDKYENKKKLRLLQKY